MTLFIRLMSDILKPPDPPIPPKPEPVRNANCFDYTTGDTIEVNSMSKLAAAVGSAPTSGRQILIAPGSYPGGSLNLARQPGSGPVVIRPRDGIGSVTITGGQWALRSNRLVISGLLLDNPKIVVFGEKQRITRCQIRNISTHAIQVIDAIDTRVDHCDVSVYTSDANQKGFVRCNATATKNGTLRHVLVDYNYCHDLTHTVGANGQDFIGYSGAAHKVFAGLVVANNLFENISLPGDGELVGTKVSGIKFQYNTVLRLGQAYVNCPRHGAKFELRSNWFEAARAYLLGDDGIAIGNRFVGSLDLLVCAGDYYQPTTDQLPTGYAAARRWRIVGNTLDSGYIRVGASDRAMGGPDVKVANTNIALTGAGKNTRLAGGNPYQLVTNWHTATTFNTDNEAFVPAVKLTPTDVGMSAADPLCPKGPQS